MVNINELFITCSINSDLCFMFLSTLYIVYIGFYSFLLTEKKESFTAEY